MESDLGKLFVGGISWDTNEERLRDYFANYGEVVEAVIMKDRNTGRARGFGFIVFADPAVAERVVMEKHTIDGRVVEAKKAVPRDDQNALNRNNSAALGSPAPARTKKIFVGGLASTVTETDFKKYFDQFGTVTDVVVMYDHNTQRPRGFGFITYDSEDAVDKVLLKTFHELNGKMVEVKRAVPKELSPGPTMRSPIGSYNYNYNLNRFSNFLSRYAQGFGPIPVGGYGMRMDSRPGPIANGRSGYSPFNPSAGYGLGINTDTGSNPNYMGNTNFNNGFGYGRALSPYYESNIGRYNNPIGYGSGNGGAGSITNSTSRNLWGNGGLNYNNASVSSSFLSSGSGNFGSFGNSNVNWGNSSPILAQGSGAGSGYGNANLGYGSGENNYGIGGNDYERSRGNVDANPSYANNTSSSGLYDGAYADLSSSIYDDPAWRSAPSELDGSSPFDYGLTNVASDTATKGYNVTDRQPNRGIAA